MHASWAKKQKIPMHGELYFKFGWREKWNIRILFRLQVWSAMIRTKFFYWKVHEEDGNILADFIREPFEVISEEKYSVGRE